MLSTLENLFKLARERKKRPVDGSYTNKLLKDKKIYRLEDMDDSYKFSEDITSISYKNNSFIYNLLTSIKQRINAPAQRTKSQN